MWDAIYAYIILQLWITSFFWSSLHIFVAVSGLYALFHVFTWSHKEGSRKWSRFRSMAIWDWLRRKHFRHTWHQGGGWSAFEKHGHAYLFIIHPQVYGLTSFMAFGLHGCQNKTIARLSPYVMMPSPPFYYPLVSDIIQWAGGIVHTKTQLQDALSHNYSVVWSPTGGMMRSHDISHGVLLAEELFDMNLFDWIATYGGQCRFSIVPVCHVGEVNAYRNSSDSLPGFLKELQRQTYNWCGVEFPLPVFGLFGSPFPKVCELGTLVGEPISTMKPILGDTDRYEKKTSHHLRDEFRQAYNALAGHAGERAVLSQLLVGDD
jgi:diacylglycerol acyltransferase